MVLVCVMCLWLMESEESGYELPEVGARNGIQVLRRSSKHLGLLTLSSPSTVGHPVVVLSSGCPYEGFRMDT